MNKLPDSIDEKLVSCTYEPTFIEIETDNIDLVILTISGEFIEIWKKEIVSSINLNILLEDKSSISVIYAYNPEVKYYLVGIKEHLIIIKRSYKLDIFKTFDNVYYFEIKDSLNIGTPLIEIYFHATQSPMILDPKNFIIQKHDEISPKLINAATIKIKSQLKSMQFTLKKYEELLLEKKALVSKMTVSSVYRGIDVSDEVKTDRLVCVLGTKSDSISNIRTQPFYVRDLSIRMIDGQWVIGFYISNLQEKPLTNLELFITNVEVFIKRTVVYISHGTPQIPLNFDMDFNETNILEYGVQGFIIGIIDEPFFYEPSLTFHCTLTFNFDKNKKKEQFYVGEISIFYSEIISQVYIPFNLTTEIQDLLSIMVTSIVSHLIINNQNEKSEESLNDILSKLGFKKLISCYFVGNLNNTFQNCLVKVNIVRYLCYLSIYTKNSQQLMLFLHSIKNSAFRGCEVSIMERNDLKKTCCTFKEELKNIKEILKTKVNGSNEFSLSYPELSLLLNNKFSTDITINNLKNFV